MADEKKEILEEDKKTVSELIFKGYGTRVVEFAGKQWKFKTLSTDEHQKIWAMSTFSEDDVTNFERYKMEIVKHALLEINEVEVSERAKEKTISALPPKVIEKLYELYLTVDKLQLDSLKDLEIINDMVENDAYSRMRFKVMRAFGALPTEQRVKDLNEHQWMWLYQNLSKERQENTEEKIEDMDYLAFFINPEMAQKVRENKKKDSDGNSSSLFTTNENGIVMTKAHDEVNPYDENSIIHYGDTTVDEDFDAKLKLFTTEGEALTELSDDTHKGNANETRDEFLTRVIGASDFVQQQNEQILENLERDAKQSGVNPDDLDGFEVH